jgi:hypothetical protein
MSQKKIDKVTKKPGKKRRILDKETVLKKCMP